MSGFHYLAIVNAVWTFIYKFLCEQTFSALLGVFLGTELQGHVITLYLIFWGPAKLFSTRATIFYISTNNVWRYQFLALWVPIHCNWSLLGVVVMYEGEGPIYHILLDETADFITVSPGYSPTPCSFLLFLSLATMFSIYFLEALTLC